MTSVDIGRVNNAVIISVAGHAGYSDNGNDVVCAAISAITQSLLQALKIFENENKCIVTKAEIREDVGAAFFSFISMSETETDAILTMAIAGYKMLENTYPKNILINLDL